MPRITSYAAAERRPDLAAALEALCIDIDELVAADDVVDDEKEQRDWRYERGDNTEGEAQQHGHEVVGDLVAVVDVLPHPQPRARPLPSGAQRAHPEHQQLCKHARPLGEIKDLAQGRRVLRQLEGLCMCRPLDDCKQEEGSTALYRKRTGTQTGAFDVRHWWEGLIELFYLEPPTG
jgi:hypothetical protein